MSLDSEIAELARQGQSDPLARWRWRWALIRAGRAAEAGLEAGDKVRWTPPRPSPGGPMWVVVLHEGVTTHYGRGMKKTETKYPGVILTFYRPPGNGGSFEFQPFAKLDEVKLLEPVKPSEPATRP